MASPLPPVAPSDCPIRLIAFDVDGTLVEHDEGLVVWQILNDRFGSDRATNARRYQDYVQGKMTYAQWVQLDIEGWIAGGATREGIEQAIRSELRLVTPARSVLQEISRRGYLLAIVSGTLDIVLQVLYPDHPFQHVFTNRIEFDAAGAIRDWQATPYDMEGKAEALRVLAARLGIAASHVAFVGDNLNDCEALRWAGCPIAYDPKDPRVSALARHVLPRGHFSRLLDLFPQTRGIENRPLA